ncbi:SpaH/EbpB family LPXTG-anchored major pilin [Pseudoflavonifractor sp. HCP28S3_F10]|uniref:SpaH/EbpB family LPXTG-anchored major pilin n=1 Tax=Pseudoflavonifractor sp. HCP28S3_F10 TaxID=3438947 RepID=UPI003F887A2C
MKNMKRIASVLLTLVMLAALAIPAMAAGANGSITIKDADNVSVAGKTFNAYKILDVKSYTDEVKDGEGAVTTPASVVYTVPAELKEFYKTRYKLSGNEGDFDAQVVAKIKAETDLFAFAADALAAAKAANITPGTATAPDGAKSVTIGNLPLGYYVVEDVGAAKPISALILDTTNPNPSVTIKADKPSIDKNIDGTKDTDNDTTGDVKYNNAAVGDKVPYKVTSKVPDMTGYTKYYFVVNDTLSKGLTFKDDVAITVGSKTLEKGTDYTVDSKVNDDGTTSVEIVFKNFIQYKELKDGETVLAKTGSDITITYSATVNKDAVIGVEGNPNKVILSYSNNPNTDESGNPGDKPGPGSPIGETPESVTRTYVTDIEIIKVDPEGNRLTGAEFEITGEKTNIVLVTKDVYTVDENGTYWKLKDGSYTTDDPATEGMDQSKYESTTVKYTKGTTTTPVTTTETVKATGVVGADGVLRFEGLSAGEYTITEIKAPAGYNLLKDSITVTIAFAAPAADATSTDCTWTYTWNSGEQNGNNVTTNNSNTVTVTNQTGTELPSTGGMGTTIFYVVGSILVIGAAVLLITKKRMGAEG